MQATQNFFGGIVDTLLTPAKFIFTGVQGIATWTVNRVSATHDENDSLDSLHQQIDQLKDQIDQRDRRLTLAEERLQQLGALAQQGLAATDLLPASITGGQAGPGANLITLDKGAADGVRYGMPVTACAYMPVRTEPVVPTQNPGQPTIALVPQATLLGVVDSVGPKTATVRLMSDPHMKTQALLVRRFSDRAVALTPDPCLVEGLGDGQLRCNTIDVGKALADPEPGDLVELADRAWPANMRLMVIGEVTAVAHKDTQLLRYDLTITPRVNINTLQTVLIVLKS
jgi:cell shape-determining protein MreC